MSGVENPSAFPNGLMGSLAESPGMTLRDYFAAAALTGLAASPMDMPAGCYALTAYAIADAMLAERAGGAK